MSSWWRHQTFFQFASAEEFEVENDVEITLITCSACCSSNSESSRTLRSSYLPRKSSNIVLIREESFANLQHFCFSKSLIWLKMSDLKEDFDKYFIKVSNSSCKQVEETFLILVLLFYKFSLNSFVLTSNIWQLITSK